MRLGTTSRTVPDTFFKLLSKHALVTLSFACNFCTIGKMKIRRRQFLIGSTATVALISAASYFAIPPLRNWKKVRLGRIPDTGIPNDSPLESTVLETVVVFVGAMFGHPLSEEDHRELSSRLNFAAEHGRRRKKEYSLLAKQLHVSANRLNNMDYLDSDPDIQQQVMLQIVQYDPTGDSSMILSLFSDNERRLQIIKRSTILHLRALYMRSGLPWRRRGYTSRPGIPGDTFAYSRPGPRRQC